MRNLIIYSLFFLFVTIGFGQQLPFKTFTTQDGLIHSNITALAEDSKGLLWIGTPFGLNWFDGNRFYEPPLKAHTGQLFITKFYKDPNGSMWVLTFYNGIYKFSEGQFLNFLPEPLTLASNSNNVFDMLQYSSQRYVVATDKDLLWFNGTSFSPFIYEGSQIKGPFNFVEKLKDGSMLIGVDQGLCYLKLEKGIFSSQMILGPHIINGIAVESQAIYLATAQGIYTYKTIYDLLQNKPKIFLKDTNVNAVFTFKADLWFISDRVHRLHNNELLHYEPHQGAPQNVSSIFVDSESIVWFATKNGLTRLVNEKYVFYDLNHKVTNAMTICLGLDNEKNIWLGNYEGLAKVDSTKITEYIFFNNEKLGYTTWILRTKNGKMLSGTEAGVMEMGRNGLSKITSLKTTKAFEDIDGTLWIGTSKGIIYTLKDKEIKPMALSDTLSDYIDGIAVDRNHQLWIGYRGYGVRKFRIKKNMAYLIQEYSNATRFKDIRVRSSSIDPQGNILFGTRTNGIYIFDPDTDINWHINTSQGLSANWVKSISFDEKGHIYLATNKGVNWFKTNSYGKPNIQRLSLTHDYGLDDSNDVLSDKDMILIANDAGFIKYQKDTILDKKGSAVLFTQLRINGKIDSSFVPFSQKIPTKKLAHNQNIIEIEFTAINKRSEDISYTYFLEGQDKDWCLPTKRNFISYNLPPNTYTLKIKTVDQDGDMALPPATFGFLISPPFWKTSWFLLIIVGLLSFGLYILYRFRINNLRRTYEIRRRISNDLHDDIGSTLSSINILSEMALQNRELKTSRGMVKEIKDNTAAIMDRMDDIIWSINPKNDQLQGLMIRIKRFAGLVFDAKGIDYSFEIQEETNMANLTMPYRQNVYLIFKESIINIAKHSCCTYVTIKITYSKGFLMAVITDNGIGFDLEGKFLGNGLHSIKDRANAIHATLNVESKMGMGTKITLLSKMK
ncbi:Two component regulator propeller [Flavobacteriaceae bacterium MAR_2010_188]|nr:Two component regulator propeller [Flavobacteriaceae bacterium MAR_2010_188]